MRKSWDMLTLRRTVIGLLVVATTAPAGAAAGTMRGARLHPLGLGPLRFGMTAAQARQAAGQPIRESKPFNSCTTFRYAGQPRGIAMTAFNGRLGYIEIYQRGPKTTKGIRVGDSVAMLRAAYGSRVRTGRSAALSGADSHLFVDRKRGGRTFTLDFHISGDRIAFISAARRKIIETFGECG
jgi:hypothetical protein